MTEDKYEALGRAIYAHIGGPENVEQLIHCMTRIRLTIKDYSKLDLDGLRQVEGVQGIVEDETLQVVVGPGVVNKVAKAMVNEVGVELGEAFPHAKSLEELTADSKAEAKAKYNKQNAFKRALKSISAIFIPLIPALVGSGLVGGVAAILSNMIVAKQISASDWAQIVLVLNIMKNGIFSYLAVFVGINAAKEFGASPSLGALLGQLSYFLV